MRRRHLLALVPALPVALLVGACEQPSVGLNLDMRFPQGVVDDATAMTLFVFDAGLAKCDGNTGHVDKIPSGQATLKFPLDKKGCTGGNVWCADIQLDKDGGNKMFAIQATKAGAIIAEGCTTATIDQSQLQVEIQAHRYSPPKCCGDGVLQPGEQCDTGNDAKCPGIAEDAVCWSDCTAKEILLSIDDKELPNLKNGAAGTKKNLALAYTPGSLAGNVMLRAVYENTDTKAVGGADVNERFLAEDLHPIATPHALSLQLGLPLTCDAVTTAGIAREQRAPAIARVSSDTVAIAYQSDEDNGGENYDIFLTAQNADGCMDAKPCVTDADCATHCDVGKCVPSIKLNVTSGGCTNPHLAAGPNGAVLVTWTRKDGIYGRIWKPGAPPSPINEIKIAPNGYAARVAGNASGFRVVYQGSGSGDPDGIYMVSVDDQGNTSGATLVNTITAGLQEQPDIAMLDNGAALVAWHSAGDILFQRFDPKGNPVAGDQDAPLNTSGVGMDSDQRSPAVAAGSGFFLVAWETTDAGGAGNIAARFVGGASGFGYNSVTGQNDEFIATDLQLQGDRHLPAVALGAYAVVGWEDRSADLHGVYVRRFPAPTAQ
jgi:hypothetical protein